MKKFEVTIEKTSEVVETLLLEIEAEDEDEANDFGYEFGYDNSSHNENVRRVVTTVREYVEVTNVDVVQVEKIDTEPKKIA